MNEDELEEAFLVELEALEKFRASYAGLHPKVPLAREDPDVRRLIEALAFFSARTRLAAERAVDQSLLRLLRQHFPYVLSPLPAAAVVRADVTARFSDAAELPRGSELLVAPAADWGRRPAYRFRTAAPLRVLPVALESVDLVPGRDKGRRIFLRFASDFARNDEIGELSLYLDHLSDPAASMALRFALKSHVKRASVIYGKVARGDEVGAPCELAFGAPAAGAHEPEAFEHPVDRFRSFVHFPEAELFVRARGVARGRHWQAFSLCLDVDKDWPADLHLTPDSFVLHAAPAYNLKRDLADPVEHDGTRERHLIRHPEVDAGYAPHSVLGAYLLTAEGMAPLEPGVLGPTDLGYEVVFEGKGPQRRAWLELALPGAFDRPRRVAVEALWTQPGLGAARSLDLRVRPADRHFEGLTWSCAGPLAAEAASDLADDRDGLLSLMAIKNQRFLGLDELTFLLRALGAARRREFERLVAGLSSVAVRSKPAGHKAGGVSHVYELEFEGAGAADLPALDLFCSKLLDLLEAWSAERVVEITARLPRLGRELRYEH
ncbi:MAG TPA: type VI secretion system baseplate subunit TssF [Polyangiaceae bacterium]|nr:type VI secretion system baseplate subunit TssF [Polyangiaceae bacterium]